MITYLLAKGNNGRSLISIKILLEEEIFMPNQKQTSKKVSSTASKLLKNNHTGKAAKTVAGSALSQTKKK